MYLVFLNDGVPGISEYSSSTGHFVETETYRIKTGGYLEVIANCQSFLIPPYNIKMVVRKLDEETE